MTDPAPAADHDQHDQAEAPGVRRRPSDVVRVVIFLLALALILPAARIEPDAVSPTGWLLHDVSPGLRRFTAALLVLSVAGVFGGGLVAAWSVRQRGAIRDVVLAGLAATAVAALVDAIVVTHEVVPAPERGIFLLVTAALAAARALVPYLGRHRRRLFLALGWTAVLAAFAGTWIGPASVVLAVVIGWGVVAAVHLTVGSPRGAPPDPVVMAAAAHLGVSLRAVHEAARQEWGLARFEGVTEDGSPVEVAVFGTDASDAVVLATLWRLVWFKGGRQRLVLSRLHQVEHEALTLLLAARSGVAVPEVIAAGLSADEELSLLITRPPAGRSLDELPPDALHEDTLTGVWRAVADLHRAGITHGQLTPAAVLVTDEGGVAFRGFHHATSSTDAGQVLTDRAELLTGLAMVAGPGMAARAACRGLGSEELTAVLPVLQPAALSSATRHRLGRGRRRLHGHHMLDELRTTAAEASGVEPPELAKLYRLTWGDAAMIAMSIVGIYLIASQLGSVDGLGATLAEAELWWALVALGLCVMTAATSAMALTGAINAALRVGPVVLLQMANQFMGLVGGTIAMTATTIRFAQKRGLGIALAVSAGVLVTLANLFFQVVVIVSSLLLIDDLPTPASVGDGDGPPTWVFAVIIGILIAVGTAVAIPRLRRRISEKVRPSFDTVFENLRALVRQPRNLARLSLGALGTQLLYALAFECSLLAFGVELPLLTLLLINTVAALFGGLAPIPGGLGVIEATLVAGLTAFGVEVVTATAGMLTYRTVSAYLPPVWGWLSLMWLRRHEYL
jgi:uncharacterized membrane protein YbhN (UPF0104 family)